MSLSFTLALSALSILSALSSTNALAQAGSVVVLKAPCDGPGLRKCDGPKGAIEEWVDAFKRGVETRTDCLYDGMQFAGGGSAIKDERDPTKEKIKCTGRKSGGDGSATSFGRTCSLAKSYFSHDMAEETSNHKSESCGKTPSVTVSSDMLVHTRPSDQGDAESAWANGGLVMSYSCFYHAIANELRTKRQVTLLPYGPEQTDCQSIARKLTETVDGYQTRLPDDFGAHGNLRDIDNPDTRLRISQAQMQAQRLAIESLFMQAIQCEIVRRATNSYDRHVSAASARDEYRRSFFDKLKIRCKKCEQDDSKITPKTPPDQAKQMIEDLLSAGGSCMSQCYAANALPSFRKYLETLYPSGDAPSCVDGDQPVPQAAFGGLLVPLAGLRRRRKRGLRAKVARALLALGIGLGLFSCKSGDLKDAPSNGGTAQYVTPTTPGIEPYGDSAANTLATGMAAGGETAALEGPGAGVQTTEAATALANPGESRLAVPTAQATSLAGGAAGLGSLRNALPGSLKAGAGGSGSSASAGAGSSGAGISGSNSAPTRADSPFAQRDPASYGGGQGGAYAEGGGAGGARGATGGAGGSENPFAMLGFGGESGAAAGGGEQSFGDGRGVNPMGSADPADYFMRTDVEVSLFKRVETCVTRQARSWALADADNAVKKTKASAEPQRLPASQSGGANAVKSKEDAESKARLWGPVTPGGSNEKRPRTF